MTCPCGKGESLPTCCGRFHSGTQWPDTALALMRARYAAFVMGEIDFLLDTHHPSTVKAVDRASIAAWSRSAEWLGLTILASFQGGPEDDIGSVEFAARYRMNGVETKHHEHSQFAKLDGRWYFVDEKNPTVPIRREEAMVGRNQPCPCGSGKKFKRCCALG